jgi:hypothetical protein
MYPNLTMHLNPSGENPPPTYQNQPMYEKQPNIGHGGQEMIPQQFKEVEVVQQPIQRVVHQVQLVQEPPVQKQTEVIQVKALEISDVDSDIGQIDDDYTPRRATGIEKVFVLFATVFFGVPAILLVERQVGYLVITWLLSFLLLVGMCVVLVMFDLHNITHIIPLSFGGLFGILTIIMWVKTWYLAFGVFCSNKKSIPLLFSKKSMSKFNNQQAPLFMTKGAWVLLTLFHPALGAATRFGYNSPLALMLLLGWSLEYLFGFALGYVSFSPRSHFHRGQVLVNFASGIIGAVRFLGFWVVLCLGLHQTEFRGPPDNKTIKKEIADDKKRKDLLDQVEKSKQLK